MMIKKEGVVS